MKYERVQLDAANTQIDWNGPFASLSEATDEASELIAEYAARGYTVVSTGAAQWHVTGPNFTARILCRPIWSR